MYRCLHLKNLILSFRLGQQHNQLVDGCVISTVNPPSHRVNLYSVPIPTIKRFQCLNTVCIMLSSDRTAESLKILQKYIRLIKNLFRSYKVYISLVKCSASSVKLHLIIILTIALTNVPIFLACRQTIG